MTEGLCTIFEGENGARVEVKDLSAPYAYRNIYHVRLEVRATFAGCQETFTRRLEKMGVFEEDLARVREELLESFRATVLPYLLREDFPRCLALSKAKETPKATGYGGGG